MTMFTPCAAATGAASIVGFSLGEIDQYLRVGGAQNLLEVDARGMLPELSGRSNLSPLVQLVNCAYRHKTWLPAQAAITSRPIFLPLH